MAARRGATIAAAGGLYAAACVIGYNAVLRNKVRKSERCINDVEPLVDRSVTQTF